MNRSLRNKWPDGSEHCLSCWKPNNPTLNHPANVFSLQSASHQLRKISTKDLTPDSDISSRDGTTTENLMSPKKSLAIFGNGKTQINTRSPLRSSLMICAALNQASPIRTPSHVWQIYPERKRSTPRRRIKGRN